MYLVEPEEQRLWTPKVTRRKMGCVSSCLGKSCESVRLDGQTCMLRTRMGWCDGVAGFCTRTLLCALNVLGTPWCLAFHVVCIYLLPCLYFSFESLYYEFWRLCCGDHLRFVDARFPANEKSLGPVETKRDVVWRRLTSSDPSKRLALFQEGIDAADIAQGALGDCWFMSALACLCEFDGAIQHLFLDKQANPRGKYRLWLFDNRKRKWVRVIVDDLVPVDANTEKPLFSQPHGDEIWVLLLEKAMAKFCGSYANIEGGHIIWAFEALTGDAVVAYRLGDNDTWEHLNIVKAKKKDSSSEKRGAIHLSYSGRKFTKDNMFRLLCAFDRRAAVLGACTRGKDETITQGRSTNKGGIVPGHAYSIISAADHEGHKLLKLRNPWGTFEWTGKWSDGSKEWTPAVARAFGYTQEDDGTFFMAWDDFCTHFDGIDVCLRTRGMSEFNLRVRENFGLCGPTIGCLRGSATFLCLCRGLYKMWCGDQEEEVFEATLHDIEEPFIIKEEKNSRAARL